MIIDGVTYLTEEEIDKLFPESVLEEAYQNVSDKHSIQDRLDKAASRMREAFGNSLEPALYVLSADCGTGKTTLVSKVLAEEKLCGFPSGGSLVLVSTLSEIDSYVELAGLDHKDYAVYTPDNEYKTYGSGLANAGKAPVLFATHTIARSRLLEAGGFATSDCFHYHGKPRAFRVWDESFSAVESATFELSGLHALPAAYKALSKADHAIFWQLIRSCNEPATGLALLVPLELAGIATRALKASIKAPEQAKRTLEALAKLAGSAAYMRGSDDAGWSFIGIGRTLPTDLAPMFVLDASARLTERYKALPAHGFKVVELDPVQLSYERLNVHIWNQAAGKTTLHNQNERARIFDGIAQAANGKPDEAFLIVMAKEHCGVDGDGTTTLPDALAALIERPERVSVCNWGRHVGTNAYRHIPNVIIVSSYNYGDDAYDALALASSGNRSGSVALADRQQQIAEAFMHNVYQAVCRTAVRVREESVSGAGNAYLIMREGKATRSLLARAFPGCSIATWTPVTKVAPKKHEKAIITLKALLANDTIVSLQELRIACGGSQKSYLTKVVKTNRFNDELRTMGVVRRGNAFVSLRSLALSG